jgi:hypothetical protein
LFLSFSHKQGAKCASVVFRLFFVVIVHNNKSARLSDGIYQTAHVVVETRAREKKGREKVKFWVLAALALVFCSCFVGPAA